MTTSNHDSAISVSGTSGRSIVRMTLDYATKDWVRVPGTDIDLLVYERRSGFTLVIQHKWVTAPETPEDSSSNDEYLRKGITQGIAAREYLRLNSLTSSAEY